MALDIRHSRAAFTYRRFAAGPEMGFGAPHFRAGLSPIAALRLDRDGERPKATPLPSYSVTGDELTNAGRIARGFND
jgi:hypothetical protein